MKQQVLKQYVPFVLFCAAMISVQGCAAGEAHPDAGISPAGHTRPVRSLAFGPDGQTLVSGGDDRILRVWDLEEEKVEQMLPGHNVMVSDLTIMDDSNLLVSSSWDGTAGLWDLRKRRLNRQLGGSGECLNAVATFGPDKLVAAGGNHRAITLWHLKEDRDSERWMIGFENEEQDDLVARNLEDRAPEDLRKYVDPVISALAFSPEGRRLAIGTRTGHVALMDVEKKEIERTIAAEDSGNIHYVGFSGDGSKLFLSGSSAEVRDMDDGQVLERFQPDGDVRAAALAPDESVLALLTKDRISLFDPESGERMKRFESGVKTDGFLPPPLVFSPDGSELAAGGSDGKIVVFDPHAGETRVSLQPGEAREMVQEPPEQESPGDDALMTNLVSAQERDEWRETNNEDRLRWSSDPEDGLEFTVRGSPRQIVARDSVYRDWTVGTRSFDLVWTVQLDQAAGNQFFQQGIAMGLASEAPERMNDDDMSAFFVLHLTGIAGEVARGEPFSFGGGYGGSNMNRMARVVTEGPVPTVNWSHEALAAIGGEEEMKFGIRRDGDNKLTFAAWCPGAGQSGEEPWWSADWTIPEKMRDVELDTLFVKRIPPLSVHMGQQGAGNDDIQMQGRITGLKAAVNPPTIEEAQWQGDILQSGDTVTLHGQDFSRDISVRVEGMPAEELDFVDQNQITVKIPDIEGGERCSLEAINPNETRTDIPIPVGRFIDEVSPDESSPEGGATVELRGGGLSEDMRVLFGERAADVLSAEDDGTGARVRVPEGSKGRISITAESDEADFSGQAEFTYADRPGIWKKHISLNEMRERMESEEFEKYNTELKKPFQDGLSEHQVLAWACVFVGEDRQVEVLQDRFEQPPEPPRPGSVDEDRMIEARSAAMAYDAVSDRLSMEVRAAMLDYLRQALDAYLDYAENRQWHLTNISWTNPRMNSAGMWLGAVLKDLHPQASEAVDYARDNLHHYIRVTWTPEGGCVDGGAWGIKGLSDYLLAANVLATVRDDRSLLEHRNLEKVHRFYETLMAGPNRFLRIRQMNVPLRGVAVCAELGNRFDNDLMLRIADHLAEKGEENNRHIAQALAFGGRGGEAEAWPDLPSISVLERVNWASMRSDAGPRPDFLVGVKGMNGPLPYHSQRSVGGILMQARGHDVLVNPGWNANAPGDHSVPIIDGEGPDATGGIITDWEQWSDMRAAVIDTTDAYRYRTGVRRVRRHSVMVGSDALVILDDIVPEEDQEGKISSQFQLGTGEVEQKEGSVEAQFDEIGVSVKPSGPEVDMSVEESGDRHAVTAEYVADAGEPLITVLSVHDSEQEEGAAMPEVSREGDEVEVAVGDRSISFRKTEEGWAVDVPEYGLLDSFPDPRDIPRAVAVQAEDPPEIDGNLDDPLWDEARAASGFVRPDTWSESAASETEVLLGWDEDNLYVAARCDVDDMEDVHTRAEYPEQNMELDERISVMFDVGRRAQSPNVTGRTVNAAGVVQPESDRGTGEIPVATGREEGDNGDAYWTMEMAMPWSKIRDNPWDYSPVPAPRSGLEMGLNVERHTSGGEHSSWSFYPETRHRWGILVLE